MCYLLHDQKWSHTEPSQPLISTKRCLGSLLAHKHLTLDQNTTGPKHSTANEDCSEWRHVNEDCSSQGAVPVPHIHTRRPFAANWVAWQKFNLFRSRSWKTRMHQYCKLKFKSNRNIKKTNLMLTWMGARRRGASTSWVRSISCYPHM